MSSGRAAVFVALAVASVAAQERSQPAFRSDTSAVVVDVVVRDKKGNPVTDLKATDFQLLEDGEPQVVRDVTLIAPQHGGTRPGRSSDAGAAPSSGGTSTQATAARTQTFVAFIFDRLSPEARVMAHAAALAYLDTPTANDFAGVFLADLSLETIQTFTNDRAVLRKAFDRVVMRPTSGFDRLRIGDSSTGDRDPGTPMTAGADSSGSAAAMANAPDPGNTRTVDPGSKRDMSLQGMIRRMERAFEILSRDQQGVTTVNSLMAVVTGLGQLPGRKTIVFFAEGLALPTRVQPRLQSLVAAANRMNVSIYSIDAAGLRVHSGQAETARRINSIGADALDRDPEKGGKLNEQLEINEDALRRDPAVSLRLLAEQTGGFFIDNTNDLAKGFREIDTDRRFHYLLTYTPTNTNFMGEWRQITVAVPNRAVRVRARNGYRALRTLGALPVLAWEAPAAALLERPAPPHDIPVSVGVFSFPGTDAEDRVPIMVSLPADRVAFEASELGYRTDFTIFVRVVDESGEAVRQAGQPYRLHGPRDQVDAARAGQILFYRQPSLAPGTYNLEVSVLDTFGRRASVERQAFTIPEPTSDIRVSSLVLVSQTERVSDTRPEADNPLVSRDLLLYPHLGGPYRKSSDKTVPFFFRLKMPAGTAAPTASLVLVKNGHPAAAVPLQLAARDPQGVIDHIAQLPVDGLPPGDFVLRLVVKSEGHEIVREVAFQIVE